MNIKEIAVLLFDNFETLDVMGPVEVFGFLPECKIRFISFYGKWLTSSQKVTVETEHVKESNFDVLLIPGGAGTRILCKDVGFLFKLQRHAEHAKLCMTVCTGSALLAKTPLLDGRKATSNKRAFHWVMSLNESVHWQPRARWVRDGKFYTSSGISAGIDMALQVVADFHGYDQALSIANRMEYVWNENADDDPFCLEV